MFDDKFNPYDEIVKLNEFAKTINKHLALKTDADAQIVNCINTQFKRLNDIEKRLTELEDKIAKLKTK